MKRFDHIQSTKANNTILDATTTIESSPEVNEEILETLEQLYSGPEDDIFLNLGDVDFSLLTQHIDPSPAISNTTLKPQSVFYLSHVKGPFLEAFYRLVFAEVLKLCPQSQQDKKYMLCNLTPKETQALKILMDDSNIIIKPADKEGGIFIQDKRDYLAEANRLLSDTNTHVSLSENPLSEYKLEAECLITQAHQEGVINKAAAFFLCNTFPNTPYFYHLPKLRKRQLHPLAGP